MPVGDAPTEKRSHPLTAFRPAEFWSGMAATAIAMCPSELLVLDRPAFNSLVHADNSAAIALLIALGKAQGNNLRWSAMEISRLAQW